MFVYGEEDELRDSLLAATTFFASSHPYESCGSNGLPLTPNAIKIVGAFQPLRDIIHSHLCRYVDIIRGKHERLILVHEYHPLNLQGAVLKGKFGSEDEWIRLAFEVLQALDFLEDKNIIHQDLSPSTILLTSKGSAKLSSYGLHHITSAGHTTDFPIGLPVYTAPELLAGGSFTSNAPIWSLGIILAELALKTKISENSVEETILSSLEFLKTNRASAWDLIVKKKITNQLLNISCCMEQFLTTCLTLSARDRPSAKQLLSHDIFRNCKLQLSTIFPRQVFPRMPGTRVFEPDKENRLNWTCDESGEDDICMWGSKKTQVNDKWISEYPEISTVLEGDELRHRSIKEVYALWQLAGGDVQAELKKQGMLRSKPPISSVGKVGVGEGEIFGQPLELATLYDSTTVILPLEALCKRLSCVPAKDYHPLILNGVGKKGTSETERLPLVIREKDIEYQLNRIVLFRRLLQGYPSTRKMIISEAKIDIPPLYRGLVWAAILGVKGDIESTYANYDKETATVIDRQIEVDIPRCHQYDELLSSPEGHRKFRRVLKGWVVSHSQYVYWQGLDSLSAPFLKLNFNNEALAYTCLSLFINKYLHGFFLRENSAVIQEYLAKYSHLLAFHDPKLATHLLSLGFIPDLYAISWFLTCFTHVFPLHEIYHLWDTLLLGGAAFPLCVGVAILQQFRRTLFTYDFDECILHFSDMPEVDMERCMTDSVRIFRQTPPSSTYRQHDKRTGEQRTDNPSLLMDPLPLSQLKSEKLPRISGQDLLDLIEMNVRDPNKQCVLPIDVRPAEEFARGCVPDSINIPFDNGFAPDGNLLPSPEVEILLRAKGKRVLPVVGNRDQEHAVRFAESLLELGYPRVCVLHKGVEVLRSTNILVVPHG